MLKRHQQINELERSYLQCVLRTDIKEAVLLSFALTVGTD